MNIRNLRKDVDENAWTIPKSKDRSSWLRQNKNLQELDIAVERLIWAQIASPCRDEVDKHFKAS